MERQKKYIHQDLLMAVILFLIGLFFFIGSFGLPKSDNPVSNIHTFPQLASGALLIFSIYNIWQGWEKSRKLNRDIAEGKEVVPELSAEKLKFPLIGVGFILLYAIGVAVIGFFVSTAVFLFASIYYLGYRKIWVILCIIGGLELFIYILFVRILFTRLPAGLLF